MSKRTITLETKSHKGSIKGKKVTVNITTPILKLKERHLETELGYFDVTVSLDFFGRLNAVYIEKTKLS